jgi:hypothetical protein
LRVYGRQRPARMAASTAVPCVLLTRKGSQVQTLSRPLPLWLVRAMSGPGGQHSSRAAAALRPQSAPWSNPMGPSGTDDTGPLPAQRPRSVVTTSLSPMVGHHAGNLPRTHLRGTGEHLLVLVLPSQPTGTLALDLLPCRPAGEAAPQPVRVRWGRPRSGVDPRASHPRPPQHHPFPSGPMRAGGRAARGPRRHIEPIRPTGTARRTEPFQGPARCGQHGCRAADTEGPSVRTPGWHRTRGHRTRGHRTSA